MRAWLLDDTTGTDALRLDDVPTPPPGPGQARVRLKVAGLNHLDVWVSKGLPKPKSLPHILGADGAGIIEIVGPHVSGWQPGDEVVINPSLSCGECEFCLADEIVFCRQYSILGEVEPGTLAEQIVVPTTSLVAKPAGLSWEVAGTFGLATSTAYRMLARAGLKAGETALVVGVGGGVSSAAALIALAIGARVLVTSRDQKKIAWATEHGAEAGFDSTSDFAAKVKEATGRGADVVVENVGKATWDQSFRSLAPGGRIVLCGATAGNKVELALPVLWFKHLTIIGSTMANRSEFGAALDLVVSGRVQLPVDQIFPFEDVPAAMERLNRGDQLGKVGIRVS
ncbi:MAG: zinc-binding dehydrogenase [Acidimicrobiia bacterium]